MTERRVDVAIIGAGSAGLAAHASARRLTASVLMIEGGVYGTTCARVGCMPSKLLIAAGDSRQGIAEAGIFGIRVGDVAVDGAAVMRRVQSLRDYFVGGVLASVAKIPETERLAGHARFEAPLSLRVGDVGIQAKSIVIATGSAPFVPDAFRDIGDRLLTTDSLFELPTLPTSLAVVGGGVIGLELGQALHRLGVRVRLFHRSASLGAGGDAVIAALATKLFTASLPCELSTDAQPLSHDAAGVDIAWHDAGGTARNERFEYVLVATGRRPRLEALDLAKAGIALDAHGVPTFDPATMRCGESAIFLAGDVDGQRAMLHEATESGRIAGENAARFPEVATHRRTPRLAIGFTSPQFAVVGASLSECDPAQTAIGEVSFADQGRSRVIAQNVGLGRLYGDRSSGRLLGAQLLGPAAEHLAHLLAWAIAQELTVQQMLDLPFYHPVIEEGLRTALKDLRRELKRKPAPARDAMDCGPGT
ncbi:MAG TPA: dihydrolipoyl dehydrogenase [Arenimonas sp.]|uniref:dihydrolipoyl dehydrogenase n=1 Tax=Arenimonas sp. TaxID=1872635 RepID=UPI002C02EEEC|nr:dihydrolipoyl dehydrogenase [Arenimonas sp.]HMB56522.1 dihydrolipoyl dehydrogenase [Arenimonas sp.]